MFGNPRLQLPYSGLSSNELPDPTRSWTPAQHAYLQALREGPTSALDRFRTLFEQRENGPISGHEEIAKLSEVLCKFYQDSSEKNDELWRASADTDFILFIIDVISGPDFLDHIPVSALRKW